MFICVLFYKKFHRSVSILRPFSCTIRVLVAKRVYFASLIIRCLRISGCSVFWRFFLAYVKLCMEMRWTNFCNVVLVVSNWEKLILGSSEVPHVSLLNRFWNLFHVTFEKSVHSFEVFGKLNPSYDARVERFYKLEINYR